MRNLCLSISILAIAITCSVARAEVGLSYLALCHKGWPCARSLSAFDGLEVVRTGWLEHSFGADCRCADRLLRDTRPKEIRVHLTNGPCLRNQRCGKYEVFAGETIASANRKVKRGDRRLITRFVRVAQKFRRRIAETSNLTCYASPMLESDLDEKARTVLHNISRSILPQCNPVDSPHRRPCLKDAICEKHGSNPGALPPCIADLDGESVEKVSVPSFLRKTKSCDISFVWSLGLNCNSHHSQAFIDPRERICAHPGGYFEGLARYLHREFR